MNFPSWIPKPIEPLLQTLSSNPASGGHRREIFARLVDDPKMHDVYQVFLHKDRKTGLFKYPAKTRNGEVTEEEQVAAFGEVLKVTISVASDRISVSKMEEIEGARQRWEDNAELLRQLAHDLELAAELGMLGTDDPLSRSLALHDLGALRRIANVLDHLTLALRKPDDPLIVERHRGDPIVRGVQILVGSQIEEKFGVRLDGTAATLTGVALGAATSPRASRSALTERKPPKRRSAN